MSTSLKVRFAPSPTGPLHIGGVRTALFNFLFAGKMNGEFHLRIEDTDTERSERSFETEIIDSLTWLGLKWQGPIVRQSERLKLYQDSVEVLLKQELAYHFEGAVKFRIQKQKIKFPDLVHGDIEFDSSTFDDFVILKSNGYPAYNFACVVDDHELGMTHLVRGDDHLSNTPRQILLYEALGWTIPQFAHLPLVLGKNGEPLSKRDGEVNLTFYREQGFIPDGILNYLALLGWSSGGNQEFFTREELVKKFSIDRVNKTSATFDIEKMKWVNGEHVKKLSDELYTNLALDYLQTYGALPKQAEPNVKKSLPLFKSRVRIWSDLLWQTGFLWKEDMEYDAQAVLEHLKTPHAENNLKELLKRLSNLSDFLDETQTENALRKTAEELGIQAKALIHPVRVALTGRSVSPSLFAVMRVLGKEESIRRIEKALRRFCGANNE